MHYRVIADATAERMQEAAREIELLVADRKWNEVGQALRAHKQDLNLLAGCAAHLMGGER